MNQAVNKRSNVNVDAQMGWRKVLESKNRVAREQDLLSRFDKFMTMRALSFDVGCRDVGIGNLRLELGPRGEWPCLQAMEEMAWLGIVATCLTFGT